MSRVRFRSRSVHTIDAKGRISIPAGLRVTLEKSSENAPILTNHARCLALYPYEEWCAYEDKLLSVSDFDPDVQDFALFMISGATECPIDRQGRILVPPPLREHAGLQREVVIAGRGSQIQIWDRARFEEKISATVSRYDQLAASVARREHKEFSMGGIGGE